MPDRATFEARLADAFERLVAPVPVAVNGRAVAAAVAAGAVTRQPSMSIWKPALLIAAAALLLVFAGVLMAPGNRLLSMVTPSPSELLFSTAAASLSPAASASPYHAGGRTNGLIAYSSNGQIFVAAPDGTDSRALTPAGGGAFAPRWSPDGKHLAFLALSCTVGHPCDQKASPASLVVVNPDGSGQNVLEENLRNVQTLEWSPDARSLAFDSDAPSSVTVVAIDGSGHRTIGDANYPRWSPDGTTIAYEGLDGFHLVAADGTGDHLLLQPSSLGNAVDPRWSPDGTHLAFFWLRSCCPPANRGSDAWLVDRSGNDPHRMSEVPAGAAFEGWSPDGRLIVYLEASQPDPPFTVLGFMANSDGSEPRFVARLSSNPVHWSPDGSRLYLIERSPISASSLVIVDPTGATPEVDLPADDVSWQPIP